MAKIKSHLNLVWIDDSVVAPSQELAEGSNHNSQVVPQKMLIPPKEELAALYESAYTGYVDGVNQEALRLQKLNSDYTPFANRILALASDFEYEEITNLINCYLS